MGKTIQVAADRAFDQTKTVLPTEVARGVYIRNMPSLQALKLLHLMIGTAGGRMAEDVQHEFRLADIKKIEGMRNHDRYTIKSLFEELQAAVIICDDPISKRYVIGGFLDGAEVDYKYETSGDILISWYFGRTFRHMAEESNHWAILDRQTVFHLGSRYSILLFQYISSLVKLDHINQKTFTVSELRSLLGVQEGKLERFSNFMQKSLKPAIEEINQLSRFILTATPNKIGRTVVSISISWIEKESKEKADTRRAMDQLKTIRKINSNEQAKKTNVVKSFPDSEAGSIYYTTWADIARDELPEPRRDLDLVAGEFRNWCQGKGINLSSKNIETTFRSFCRKVDPVY